MRTRFCIIPTCIKTERSVLLWYPAVNGHTRQIRAQTPGRKGKQSVYPHRGAMSIPSRIDDHSCLLSFLSEIRPGRKCNGFRLFSGAVFVYHREIAGNRIVCIYRRSWNQIDKGASVRT